LIECLKRKKRSYELQGKNRRRLKRNRRKKKHRGSEKRNW